MKITRRTAGSLAAAALTTVTAAVTAVAVPATASAGPATGVAHTSTSPASARHADAGAVFMQTNALDGNRVLAYRRGGDGRLTATGSYATHGLGGILDGAVADRLASQGSLAYDRANSLLYAVNAGSSTVSVFAVHGSHLALRQVVRSGGTFPVSVAVRGDRVYVLNAEGHGSVQGFLVRGGGLLRIASWHRSLGLDPAATPQFVSTPGQVAFSPDGRHLLVTTKAGTSSVDVFGFGRAGRPTGPRVTSLPGAVPFAMVFDSRGDLAVAEAGTNTVATYKLASNGTLTPRHSAATGQLATCWIVEAKGSLYASNPGSGTVSGFAERPGGALTPLGDTATDAGTIDAAASRDGRYLYVQAGVAGTVDEFAVGAHDSLTRIGTVATAVGQEGIVAS